MLTFKKLLLDKAPEADRYCQERKYHDRDLPYFVRTDPFQFFPKRLAYCVGSIPTTSG